MKKKEKLNQTSFLLLLLLFVVLIPTFSHLILGNLTANFSNSKTNDRINIKSSDWWDLSADRIFIDGDATGVGAHNWTWAESQDWCTGLGTWTSPYIIENITINCNRTDYGILIRDSNVYFRIQNCTVFNSDVDYNDAAISLLYVLNGTIYNNTLSNGNGLYIFIGNNISISENIMKNNTGTGIYTSSSDNIKIIGNTIKNNGRGISINGGNNHTVIGNDIMHNYDRGIDSNAEFNNITGNTIINNSRGIDLAYSEGNYVEGNNLSYHETGIWIKAVTESNFTNNEINDNTYHAIWIESWCEDNNFTDNSMMNSGIGLSWGQPFDQLILYEPIDSSNTINSRPLYFYVNETDLTADKFTNAGQVILINCNDSIILNANASYGSRGISLFYCENVTITGCDVSNNIYDGIIFYYGAHNKILNSTVNNNGLKWDGYGIDLSNSLYSYLYNNTVKNAFRSGIRLSQSNYSSLIDNIVTNNGIHAGDGITVEYSEMCKITGNIAEDNSGSGIRLDGIYCNITNNIADGNQYGILVTSENNNFTANSVGHNTKYGFLIEGDGNNFSENVATYNLDDGFYSSGTELNELYNNTASYNYGNGYKFLNCYNCTIVENRAMNNVDGDGIDVENGNNHTILRNFLFNNDFGISIYNSENSLISGNTIKNCSSGIYGQILTSTNFIGNKLESNFGMGLIIYDGNNVLISENVANFNDAGIGLSRSTDCIISNNTANYNIQRGFWISHTDDSEIINNIASYNGDTGIEFGTSTYITISGNTFNNNSEHGVVIVESDYIIISGNTINNNTKNGIDFFISNFNTISDNILMWNAECFEEDTCTGNIFTNNNCVNRPKQPTTTDGAAIPGYNLFFLILITVTGILLLNMKHKKNIKFK